MIWRLMKLAPMGGWLPAVGVASLVLCAIDGDAGFWFILVFLGFTEANRPSEIQFFGPLPVDARDILAARIFGLLVLLWLPLMLYALFRQSTIAVAAGSLLTLLLIWQQTRNLRELPPRTWLMTLPFLCVFAAMFGKDAVSLRVPWIMEQSGMAAFAVTTSAWVAITAVLFHTLRTSPELLAVKAEVADVTAPGRVWVKTRNPILHLVWSLNFHWVLCFLFALWAGIRASVDMLLFPIFFLQPWNYAHPELRWLSLLPARPATMLAAVLLPGAVAMGCGYAIGSHLPVDRFVWLRILLTHSRPYPNVVTLQAMVFQLLCLASLMMVGTLFSMAEYWRVLYRLPGRRIVVRLSGLALLISVSVAYDLIAGRWLASVSTKTAAVPMAVLFLALIYWLCYAMFRQLEFADKVRPGGGA